MEKDNNTVCPICNEDKELDFEEVIEANPDGLDFDEMMEKLINIDR